MNGPFSHSRSHIIFSNNFSTFLLWVDHVQDLAYGVFDRDAVNVEFLESLQHLLVEVDQLKEREDSISIDV